MRRPSLTQPPSREHVDEVSGEAETVTAYEWGGAAVWVRDSAMRALRVIELFVDESVEPEQKALWLPHMMFADPWAARDAAGDDPQAMAAHIAWEAYGIDITGGRAHDAGAAAFDWAQDAGRIRASLMSAYGLDWAGASRSLSFCDLCGLLGSLMETAESSPFAEAVSARLAKPPKPTKWNREEREALEARKRHFALKTAAADPVRAQNDAAADQFAAALAAAKRKAARNG
ncbi:Gp15 family bacteriophage protein [Adlercreutzia muris]|uniref:Gp15 family bacteriophage protein n=1 Tax=Adlercreutzia muris TaxID=1796610 RepID=UPI003517D0B1